MNFSGITFNSPEVILEGQNHGTKSCSERRLVLCHLWDGGTWHWGCHSQWLKELHKHSKDMLSSSESLQLIAVHH